MPVGINVYKLKTKNKAIVKTIYAHIITNYIYLYLNLVHNINCSNCKCIIISESMEEHNTHEMDLSKS